MKCIIIKNFFISKTFKWFRSSCIIPGLQSPKATSPSVRECEQTRKRTQNAWRRNAWRRVHIYMWMWRRHVGPRRMPTNAKKVACSAFVTQANEQVFRWLFLAAWMNGRPHQYDGEHLFHRTYFSLKYRLQTDSIACSLNIRRISEWRWRLFAYTSTLCVFAFVSHPRTDVDTP